jgi:hypothetical protein
MQMYCSEDRKISISHIRGGLLLPLSSEWQLCEEKDLVCVKCYIPRVQRGPGRK